MRTELDALMERVSEFVNAQRSGGYTVTVPSVAQDCFRMFPQLYERIKAQDAEIAALKAKFETVVPQVVQRCCDAIQSELIGSAYTQVQCAIRRAFPETKL